MVGVQRLVRVRLADGPPERVPGLVGRRGRVSPKPRHGFDVVEEIHGVVAHDLGRGGRRGRPGESTRVVGVLR